MRHLRKLERTRFNLKRLRSRREPAWRTCARPALASVLLGSALLCGAASVALAAEGQVSGASAAIFFAQVGILLLVGRALGELMQRLGQPAVTGQISPACCSGPRCSARLPRSCSTRCFPPSAQQQAMLDAVAQLGILLLLLHHRHGDRSVGVRARSAAGRRASRSAASSCPSCAAACSVRCCPDRMLPQPQRRLDHRRCSSARRCRFPRSRSWRWWCASWDSCAARSDRSSSRQRYSTTPSAGSSCRSRSVWRCTAPSTWPSSRTAVLGVALFLVVSLTFGRRLVFSILRWSNDNFASEMANITTILVITGLLALTHQRARRAFRARRVHRRRAARSVADAHPAARARSCAASSSACSCRCSSRSSG